MCLDVMCMCVYESIICCVLYNVIIKTNLCTTLDSLPHIVIVPSSHRTLPIPTDPSR